MNINRLISVFIMLLIISCNSKINDTDYAVIQKKGDEISSLSQAVLLANVGIAIQTGGPAHAVEFCNLKASSITDSLNNANNCVISRISAKNRSPYNKVGLGAEDNLYKFFEKGVTSDTVILIDNKLVYYKSISIALPACLKCHGEAGVDIDLATAEKLKTLYPGDRATGYKLNDFRGLWKIEFKKIN